MNKYEDCMRCGAVDGMAVFHVNHLNVWAYLCPECYELCKQIHTKSRPECSKPEDSERNRDAIL